MDLSDYDKQTKFSAVLIDSFKNKSVKANGIFKPKGYVAPNNSSSAPSYYPEDVNNNGEANGDNNGNNSSGSAEGANKAGGSANDDSSAKNESAAPINDTDASGEPVVTDAPKGLSDTKAGGNGNPGEVVKVYDEAGDLIVESKVDSEGNYYVNFNRQEAGTKIKIVKTNLYTNEETVEYIEIAESEVPEGQFKLDRINHKKYMIGYKDGSFRPDAHITRAEFATILSRIANDKVAYNNLKASDNSFTDNPLEEWYFKYLIHVSNKKVMQGYLDKSFKPNQDISREEFVHVVSKFVPSDMRVNPFTDAQGRWSSKDIAKLFANDYIKGYPNGNFKPEAPITRAEAVKVINFLLDRKTDNITILSNLKVRQFTDVDKSHWAYYDILEATNTHKYERRNKLGTVENWTEIIEDDVY